MIKKLFHYFANPNFFKYFGIGLMTSCTGIATLWILVDLLNVWVVWAGIFEAGEIFLLRYLLYDKFKMLDRKKGFLEKKDEPN